MSKKRAVVYVTTNQPLSEQQVDDIGLTYQYQEDAEDTWLYWKAFDGSGAEYTRATNFVPWVSAVENVIAVGMDYVTVESRQFLIDLTNAPEADANAFLGAIDTALARVQSNAFKVAESVEVEMDDGDTVNYMYWEVESDG